MKKFVALLVMFLILLPLTISCDVDSTSGTNSTVSGEGTDNESNDLISKYQDETGRYISTREKKDWDKREFRILVLGERYGTYQSDDFTEESELYGETLSDAVILKQDRIEEEHNVKLVIIKSDTIDDDIRTDYQAQSGDYDLIMPQMAYLARIAPQGMLRELTSIESLDLDAPWFDSSANETFSIGGKLFFTTGDMTILNKVITPSVLFNKDILATNELDSPYDLVRNHKWTFDKMNEMAKDATVIHTDTPEFSDDNIYGALAESGNIIVLFGGSGNKVCKKDNDDNPYLTIDDKSAVDVLQKILDEYSGGNWYVFSETFPAPVWDTSLAAFLENKILFRISYFSATTKIRQRSNLNFGIVPVPLWSEDQENYHTYSSGATVAGIAIPIFCEDVEFSSYMIEAISAESKNTITPAYYDINLRRKDAMDTESQEMLDIIFDNISYDIGLLYNFASITSELMNMFRAGNTSIVSKIESLKPIMESKIEEVIEGFEFSQ